MAKKRRKKRLLIRLAILSVGLLLIGILACNLWITLSTHSRIFETVEDIPKKPVGIVLGTSKKIGPETGNPHFVNRMAAAAELFLSGKVDRLIVSGHRDSKYYDEPRDMISQLNEVHAIPKSAIIGDGEGHRTLDSLNRAKNIHGCDQVVIVSDDFHVSRALFIADRVGLNAVAYRSEPVDFETSSQTRLREYFARVKAVMDLYLPAKKDFEWANLSWRSSDSE